ncbi:MAG: hypothetical protein OXG35_25990, partial [Acidobacteria bacterium]|nr:hypothetical protein [Acidobacteriota bacterium]
DDQALGATPGHAVGVPQAGPAQTHARPPGQAAGLAGPPLPPPGGGEWVGLEPRGMAEPWGIGLCRPRLWDADGVAGRGAQSLVVAARS